MRTGGVGEPPKNGYVLKEGTCPFLLPSESTLIFLGTWEHFPGVSPDGSTVVSPASSLLPGSKWIPGLKHEAVLNTR